MRFQRYAGAIGMAAAGALLLGACGGGEQSAAPAPGEAPPPGGAACAGQDTLRASGSSAQANAMVRFITNYETQCEGKTVNYTPSGSGAGRDEFIGGQTDFAGSDSALSAEDGEVAAAQQRCGGAPAWHEPLVFGPIALAYNLPGITDLVLDGPTAARVFNGSITTWNDPAIAAINPGKALPAIPIVVQFRSDDSGTTENFQTYLEAASNGAWARPVSDSFNGGVGAGASGSEGVANATAATPGSITYVESSFAQRLQLPAAQIINSGGGAPVALTPENVGRAIEGVQIIGQGNDLVLDLTSLYTASAPGAYPIALATYEIVCSRYPTPETGLAVKGFLTSALSDAGQQGLTQAGYVPLPQQFRQRVTNSVNAIQQ